jgi:hypothetical protein
MCREGRISGLPHGVRHAFCFDRLPALPGPPSLLQLAAAALLAVRRRRQRRTIGGGFQRGADLIRGGHISGFGSSSSTVRFDDSAANV